MAAQTNRTVTLTLDAQTTGTDGIVNLAKELRKLGKQGGDAAPEFERLATELQGIADQQATVNTMKALTDEVQKSVGVMNSAKEAVVKEDAALDALNTTLRAAKASEEAHAASVRAAVATRQQANQQYLEARAKISEYVASIGGAKRANDEQKVTLRELNQSLRESKAAFDNSKAAVAALTPEYDKLKSASAGIAAEVKQQEGALRAVAKVADSAKENYNDLTTALADTSQQADRLGINTADLVGEQNRLKQSTLQLTQEADKLKVSLKTAGDAALTSAQRIAQAFAGTSVKSANTLQNEILKINQGLIRLAKDAKLTEYDFNSAFNAGKARITELEAAMRKAEGGAKSFGGEFANAFRQFGPATLVFNGVSAAISAITSSASQIPKVTAEFQTMFRTLTILTGSTAAAAKEFQYIKDVANRVGGEIKGLGDGYIKLTAATKDTNLAGAQTRRIFEAVSGSMGVLGASADATEGALMAVTQMVSKGVVSMEEMRQQLSERLPGAFQATAKELGITTADLTELISTGKLAADDVLPAMARGLEKMYKSGSQNDTLIGKWRQFTNALKDSASAIGESGILEALLAVGRTGAAVATQLTEGFLFVGKVIGKVAAGIATGNLQGALAELGEEAEKMNARIAKIGGYADKSNKSLGDLAEEAKRTGQAFVTMADGTKLAVADIEGANTGFISFLTASTKAQNSAETFATSARKAAEYTRAAGEASITAANALGTETDKRETATKVAQNNTTALNDLVVAEQKVLTIMEAEALKRAEAIRDGEATSDAHKKQLADLGEELAKRKSAVDGLTQQAEANRVLAEALKIEAETIKDNSGRLEELRAVNLEFANALEIVRAAVEAGSITQQQANAVEEEARKVKALYSDAIKDQIEKIEALKNAKIADVGIEQANVRLAIEVQKGIIASARARGDEVQAVRAGNEIKRLEIQMAQLVAKAKQAEAEASRLLAIAKIEEIRASGPLTAAKEAEIRALEASVKVKEIEAKIAGVTAKSLDELRFATVAAANEAAGSTGGYDNLAASMNNAADAAVRLREEQSYGSSNGTVGQAGTAQSILDDPAVRGRVAPVDVEAQLYKRGASVEEAKAAAKYYGELYARESATRLTGNLGNGANAARTTNQVANSSMDKALELARQELASGQAIDLGVSVNDLVKKNLATMGGSLTPEGGYQSLKSAYNRAGNEAKKQGTANLATVNINLNGNRTQITATQDDAKALTNLFKIIESDASRAF